MFNNSVIFVFVGVVGIVLIALLYVSCYKKVKNTGQAIVVNGFRNVEASITGLFVWPWFNSYAFMDISRRQISIKQGSNSKAEGYHCKDNIRANLKVDFYIGVNQEPQKIKEVALLLKPEDVNDIQKLEEHFSPKFSAALKAACRKTDFVDLLNNREQFKRDVIEVIKEEMDGFIIYDVVIDDIAQAALEDHDENNVLDSEGRQKISKITAERKIATNIIIQDEKTNIKSKDVDAGKAILQLEKQEAQAKAVNDREIAIINAAEQATAKEKEEEYTTTEEEARIKREEKVEILEEQKNMEVDVAKLNNKKKITIQEEDVNRTNELEKVKTSKEVAEQNIQKDITVETGNKEVADITSQRVEIERKIAKEEEETKDLRAVKTAERDKNVKLTNAEAIAEASKTEEVTKAQASKISASEQCEQLKIEAETSLYQSEKKAEAIGVLSEAKQKDISAVGLAEVTVDKERANVIELTGNARASEIRETGKAEAEAKEAGLLAAEKGSKESRDYEKWIKTTDVNERLETTKIHADKESNIERAKAMADTFSKADIKLFGGDGIQDIQNAVLGSMTMDAKVSSSEHLTKALSRYDGTEENLISDIISILEKSEVSTGDITNIGVAKFLANNPNIVEKVSELIS